MLVSATIGLFCGMLKMLLVVTENKATLRSVIYIYSIGVFCSLHFTIEYYFKEGGLAKIKDVHKETSEAPNFEKNKLAFRTKSSEYNQVENLTSIFVETKDEFTMINEFNLNKNIMRILKWVMLLVLLLFATLIIVDVIEALDKKSVTAEQVEVYRLKQGDLQYSDSIVINTLGVNTVYNINTKKYLHKDEMYHLLPFDMVSESRVVYVDTAYNRGYLNVVTGEIDIKAEYDYAWLFPEGVAAVVKDNKIGFIDKENNVVIPFQYPVYGYPFLYTYRLQGSNPF